MIRKTNLKQLSFDEFDHDLSAMGLAADNRWVILSKLIDQNAMEDIYNLKFSPRMEPPVINSRIVIGALIIKHIDGLSDRRTILAIHQNFYTE